MYRGRKKLEISKKIRHFRKYRKPPVPEGYEYVSGKWNGKLIIRNKKDGSEFVWVPVCILDNDGILTDNMKNEKFGRRNFHNDEFSSEEFHEEMSDELLEQHKSVKKYGGFFISRFNISKTAEGKPISVSSGTPWTQINWFEAKKIAKSYGDGKFVKSHLPYGAEIDSMLSWANKFKENEGKIVTERKTHWKQHAIAQDVSVKISKEDKNSMFKLNDIFKMDGNIDSWTQEECGSYYKVLRGSGFIALGNNFSASFRSYEDPNEGFFDTGFRIVLCIE